MPPCEPVFQVIMSGHDGENLMRPDQQRSTLAILLNFTPSSTPQHHNRQAMAQPPTL